MSKRVFAVAAHPDDIEFTMAGTLFLLKAAGWNVHLMHIGNGSCGSMELPSDEIARVREREAREAAAMLDATQGMDSYLQTMEDLSREVGQMSGCFEYAEGFRKHLHYGFCGPDDDPVQEVLADACRVA